MGLAGVGAQVIVPEAEGEGVLLAGRELGQAERRGRDRDFQRPAARDGARGDRETGDEVAPVGLAAVDRDGELVRGAAGPDAQLDAVIPPICGLSLPTRTSSVMAAAK